MPDDSKWQPRSSTSLQNAQLLIMMGCGDKCPYVPGLLRDDWPLADPKGRPIEEVRAIRDDVKARVLKMIVDRGFD